MQEDVSVAVWGGAYQAISGVTWEPQVFQGNVADNKDTEAPLIEAVSRHNPSMTGLGQVVMRSSPFPGDSRI